MNISPTYSQKIINNSTFKKQSFKPILKQIQNSNVLITNKSPKKSKNFMRTLLLSTITLISSITCSCATLRGGNFVYNEETDKVQNIEDFKKIKPTSNILNEEIKTNKFNLNNCFDKEYLKAYGIDKFIEENKEKLEGSCIFSQGDNFISKGIRFFTNTSNCDKDEVPSHSAP